MALSLTQRTKIRMFLCYEMGYDLNSQLETKMDTVSDEEITEIALVLTKLANLDTAMDDSVSGGVDGLKSLDQGSVVFQDASEQSLSDAQNARGRALVTRLESLLGVKRNFDFFSDGSSSGGAICLG